MYRATTPTHVFWFNNIDPDENFSKILITYVQDGETLFEKTKQDLTFGTTTKDGEVCYYGCITLTQAETNKISADKSCPTEIQMRVKDYYGNVMATNKIRLTANDVLNDSVME